uniref:Leucine-rich repeat domain-containing protein n=1 Tax=Anisakis simplex TaxID=6269 RepID=A0A0M3J7X7_ANISI
LIDVVENNETLKSINLETNYLSGDFFAKLFKAALKNQTLEEVKAVNQGVTFSTTSEKEIIDAIFENRGIIKVSINLRLPEGRHKIENAMLRNGEIKRVLRRQAAQAAKAAAEEEAKKAESAPKPTTATGKKTDEVTKPKKALNKTASPTTPAKTTAAKPAPSKPATAPKTSLTKTPASDASSTDTSKKVPPKTAPKSTIAKGTAASSTKSPPLSKSTALDGTPSSGQKPAAGTTKKLATAKPTDAAGTTEKV